jgi:hypothetical protein
MPNYRVISAFRDTVDGSLIEVDTEIPEHILVDGEALNRLVAAGCLVECEGTDLSEENGIDVSAPLKDVDTHAADLSLTSKEGKSISEGGEDTSDSVPQGSEAVALPPAEGEEKGEGSETPQPTEKGTDDEQKASKKPAKPTEKPAKTK